MFNFWSAFGVTPPSKEIEHSSSDVDCLVHYAPHRDGAEIRPAAIPAKVCCLKGDAARTGGKVKEVIVIMDCHPRELLCGGRTRGNARGDRHEQERGSE